MLGSCCLPNIIIDARDIKRELATSKELFYISTEFPTRVLRSDGLTGSYVTHPFEWPQRRVLLPGSINLCQLMDSEFDLEAYESLILFLRYSSLFFFLFIFGCARSSLLCTGFF